MALAFQLLSKLRLGAETCRCGNFRINSKSILNLYNSRNRRNIHNKKLEDIDRSAKIRSFVLGRYINYVKDYDKVLETRFPAAMRVYRVFMVGTKEFYTDLKSFLRIIKALNTSKDGFKCLKRNEIELYHKMPKDMVRVAPVLLLSAVPLSNYLIFPLAYFFPRFLLSSHFWSIQQRSEFAIMNLSKRLAHYKPVFRCIQERLKDIQPMEMHLKWAEVISLLGSGQQPTAHVINECKCLYDEKNVYHIKQLTKPHIKELLKMHNLRVGLFRRRRRLIDHAKILHEMDMAILREGGVTDMTCDVLKNALFIRGLNGTNMKHEDMIQFLNSWLCVSQSLDENNITLLLHLPILLAYNQPSNWMLIYNKRYKHIV
ncbi:LETM1 domain-containing protein 1 [Chrysoperla carnea]|uniref:LETM1 domain-containing protein 1 n=1 Tax=Chrysoperla carnea TaxID=189513 RepID=UPI001D096F61|nr:LETM1 domain-containing protein 1 [Chrysoperla carnea]